MSRLSGLAGLGRMLGALEAASIGQMVQQAAAANGLDPALALRLAQAESNLNPNAVSSQGAKGVMQLMDGTAAALGVSDPFDPQQNISAGVRYLAQMISRFGDTVEGVAAYNWGPTNVSNAVATYGADWLSHAPAETQYYVQRILGVTPSPPAAPTSSPASALTIDAATGQIVPTTTDVTSLPSAVDQIQIPTNGGGPTSQQMLLVGGIVVAVLFVRSVMD